MNNKTLPPAEFVAAYGVSWQNKIKELASVDPPTSDGQLQEAFYQAVIAGFYMLGTLILIALEDNRQLHKPRGIDRL